MIRVIKGTDVKNESGVTIGSTNPAAVAWKKWAKEKGYKIKEEQGKNYFEIIEEN